MARGLGNDVGVPVSLLEEEERRARRAARHRVRSEHVAHEQEEVVVGAVLARPERDEHVLDERELVHAPEPGLGRLGAETPVGGMAGGGPPKRGFWPFSRGGWGDGLLYVPSWPSISLKSWNVDRTGTKQ